MTSRFLSAILALSVLGAVPAAQAVTVDLTSPQEGGTIHPGDTLSITVTATNDSAETDKIKVSVAFMVTIDGERFVFTRAHVRMELEPGQTASQTLTVVTPTNLPLTGPAPVLVRGKALGNTSGTQASDTLALTMAP